MSVSCPYYRMGNGKEGDQLRSVFTFPKKFGNFEFGDRKEVDNLKNTECMDEKKHDEPDPLPSPSRMPHTKPLPNDGPDDENNKEGRKKERQPRHHIASPPGTIVHIAMVEPAEKKTSMWCA